MVCTFEVRILTAAVSFSGCSAAAEKSLLEHCCKTRRKGSTGEAATVIPQASKPNKAERHASKGAGSGAALHAVFRLGKNFRPSSDPEPVGQSPSLLCCFSSAQEDEEAEEQDSHGTRIVPWNNPLPSTAVERAVRFFMAATSLTEHAAWMQSASGACTFWRPSCCGFQILCVHFCV